jgi:hypothetical protein
MTSVIEIIGTSLLIAQLLIYVGLLLINYTLRDIAYSLKTFRSRSEKAEIPDPDVDPIGYIKYASPRIASRAAR